MSSSVVFLNQTLGLAVVLLGSGGDRRCQEWGKECKTRTKGVVFFALIHSRILLEYVWPGFPNSFLAFAIYVVQKFIYLNNSMRLAVRICTVVMKRETCSF